MVKQLSVDKTKKMLRVKMVKRRVPKKSEMDWPEAHGAVQGKDGKWEV